ncbi:MAG TPA: exosortase/archaeosortase family protein [Armatimonadota bacterium]|jgi:exosortase
MTADRNDETTAPAAETRPDPIRTWAPAFALAIAFLWLFHGTIANMADRWSDPTFSHGWIVAPAAVVIAWFRRDTWVGVPFRPATGWGLAIILFGLISMVAATVVAVMFWPCLSMMIVIGGMIVYLAGWQWMRLLAFPYAFLYFMVPWPDFLVETISFPMQLSTSAYATLLGSMVGIPVVRDGVNLHIGPPVNASFEVAVACSGMHSLVALLCLGAGFAYFTPAAMWKRWTLFLLGLPMALAANIFRVFLILCVANWISPQLAAKAFHDWSSPVLFLINTLGLLTIRNMMLREPKAAPAVASRPVEDDDAF